ncbi:MAG: signal recognition particle-docking protein FtsY [Oligoflexus sp.]
METASPTSNPDIQFSWDHLNTLINQQDPMVLIIALLVIIALFGGLGTWIYQRRKKSRALKPEQAPREVQKAPAKPAAPSPAIPSDVSDIKSIDRGAWLVKLRGGLSRTRAQIAENLATILSRHAKLDEDLLEELHETLFRADIGIETADKLIQEIRKRFASQSAPPTWEEVRAVLSENILSMLKQTDAPLKEPSTGPLVILIVGVNGVGKTTSIGKLAAHYLAQDKKVLLAAGDTFRAAAIDQLQVWAERLGCDIIKHQPRSDPAAVAYDAVKSAMAKNYDVLLIDTAGRLHNKKELMDELGKVRRVIGKDLPEAPHETWLVIDATTGQNAFQQVKAFSEVCPLTGLIVTKLDGTAKGGVVIGTADRFSLPIRFVGVGEKAADLRPFRAEDFVESLF